MALSEKQIKGLRELAARGIGGEKDNAKAILKKNNIPLEAPPEVKQTGPETFAGFGRKSDRRPFSDDSSGGWHPGSSFDFRDDVFENIFKHSMNMKGRAHSQQTGEPRIRFDDVKTKMQAQMLSIIAGKLYPAAVIRHNASNGDTIVTGLSMEEAQQLNRVYERNCSRMAEVAIKAMRDIPLI